jgi:hypothetical protein
VAGTNGNGAGASHLDWLRARHEVISADRHLDLDVPGYQGRLVIRYGAVPWSVISKAQDKIAKPGRDGEGSLLAQVDFLIAACREVLVRESDSAGEPEPIDPNGDTRRFDPELAALLNSGTSNARALVRWLFANDPAVAVQAGEVMSWSIDTDADVTDDLMGESAPVVK